ncbi:flagellar export chaperone FliS [Paenibacillus polymyxa]|uniref:flagellar export chaperone FliS n=1 Tax=Paenibacillus polymyxa TaxID=1406 RepID=UPI0002F0C235|nr:flagellar export chaperone FliS [Paenibacillus polymyxa]MBY7738399.1 flagellar export chaperone FliS [Paenibacillus polymyxa]MEE4563298.1 flagellar export chaperone FliS [Paenibacillus polymyxa]MEE4578260.1 flagellar export chaperone FliS [Paenibacillus polymyxa]NMP12164.1 flagellar export chaperone FliS [Paenibacillus polymyxa]UQQ34908.1 flagellar export chaperone FliS [Paenibacillus polymyxa]
MISSPYEKYKQSSVQTSTPGQLIIMLYDGAIRFVRAGLDGISSNDIAKANINLVKAQSIISELMSTLNYSYDISKNLYALYEYMNYLLIQTNIKKKIESGEEVLGYLQELRETWITVNKLTAGMSLSTEQ